MRYTPVVILILMVALFIKLPGGEFMSIDFSMKAFAGLAILVYGYRTYLVFRKKKED